MALVGSAKCGKGWGLPYKEFAQYRLMIIRGGSGELMLKDHTVPLHRGSVLFSVPGDSYGVRQNQQKRLVVSIVRFESYVGKRMVFLPRKFRPSLCSEVKCFPLIEELMLRLTNAVSGKHVWASGLSDSLLRSALWLIREDHHSGDNLQEKNISYESLRPALQYKPPRGGREPSTSELARMCGMSTSTFARKIRLGYGVSPKKFLIQKRMEHAKKLLVESPYSVEGIAAELGYKEPGHFTRQFKKWVGVSPSVFRTSDR
jgi:AraC-like DNA-binding protein